MRPSYTNVVTITSDPGSAFEFGYSILTFSVQGEGVHSVEPALQRRCVLSLDTPSAHLSVQLLFSEHP